MIPLLDDVDHEIRASALRIVSAVLSSACDVSAVVGIAAVPRLADADDKTIAEVLLSALSRLREDDSDNPRHCLRYELMMLTA